MKKKNKHSGSNFDDFLRSEGILEEAEAYAAKAIISYKLKQEMDKKHISQTEMAERLGTSRAALNRLLDPSNVSVTLLTLNKVATVLNQKLEITLSPIKSR